MRDGIGTSRERIAKWARVSVPTVALFEANPHAVGEECRKRIARVFRLLGRALDELEEPSPALKPLRKARADAEARRAS